MVWRLKADVPVGSYLSGGLILGSDGDDQEKF
jgi:hypothetical protein